MKLVKNQPQIREVHLSVMEEGDKAFVKPIMFGQSHLSEAITEAFRSGKYEDMYEPALELFKELLVDENGESFEDMQSMTLQEFKDTFQMTDVVPVLHDEDSGNEEAPLTE